MTEIEQKSNLTERIIRRVIKENNWTQARERYCRMLCQISLSNSLPLYAIAEKTGINYYFLCRIRKKYQVEKAKRKAWNDRRSEKLEQKIIILYNNGKTARQIIKETDYKKKESVYQILEKHSINRRAPKIQTYYDESFFEKIDSHKKAYILGLIMTDGNIIKDYSGFEMQLTKSDGYILRKISNLIGASKTHSLQKIDCSHKRIKGFRRTRDMVRLTVHNRKIAEDLKKLGVVRNKSKILRYNGCVQDKFLGSFFRGLIDGDGTVGIDGRGYLWLKLVSASKEFLLDLKKVLNFDLKIWNKNCCYELGNCRQNDIIDILKWMYNDKEDFYLRRKYEKIKSKIM